MQYADIAQHVARTAMIDFREKAKYLAEIAESAPVPAPEPPTEGVAPIVTRGGMRDMASLFTQYADNAEKLLTALEEGTVQLVELDEGCTGTITAQYHANRKTRWSIQHDDDTCPVHEGA